MEGNDNVVIDSQLNLVCIKGMRIPSKSQKESSRSVLLPFISENAAVTVSVSRSRNSGNVTFYFSINGIEQMDIQLIVNASNGNKTLKILNCFAQGAQNISRNSGSLRIHEISDFIHGSAIIALDCYIKPIKGAIEAACELKERKRFVSAFERGLGSDTKFLIGNKSIEVAKFFLIASSKVFEAMFSNDWKDVKNNEIQIKGIEYDTMYEFVRSLYCDRYEATSTLSAMDVYVVAEKYDVDFVKSDAMEYMENNLDCEEVESVLEMFKVAALNDVVAVKKITANHLAENMTNEIVLEVLCLSEKIGCDQLREAALEHVAKLRGRVRITELPGYSDLSFELLHLILARVEM